MVDSCYAGESRIRPVYWAQFMCPVHVLPWTVSCPLTQYSLSKSESPEHNCSRPLRFTISSARANNPNQVRVLTKLQ